MPLEHLVPELPFVLVVAHGFSLGLDSWVEGQDCEATYIKPGSFKFAAHSTGHWTPVDKPNAGYNPFLLEGEAEEGSEVAWQRIFQAELWLPEETHLDNFIVHAFNQCVDSTLLGRSKPSFEFDLTINYNFGKPREGGLCPVASIRLRYEQCRMIVGNDEPAITRIGDE